LPFYTTPLESARAGEKFPRQPVAMKKAEVVPENESACDTPQAALLHQSRSDPAQRQSLIYRHEDTKTQRHEEEMKRDWERREGKRRDEKRVGVGRRTSQQIGSQE
jgi:hypothetical protein